MRTKARYMVIGTMLVILLIVEEVGEADTWITLDPPGAISTEPWGVEGSIVVGEYTDASYIHHGFIYDGTDYVTLDYPGATHTYARDIYGGIIVGGRIDSSGEHGFIYDGTDWTPLDYSGAWYSPAVGIHDDYIVGTYITDTRHGFLYHNGAWTMLDFPGAYQTELYDIDGANIVGSYNFYSGLIHYGYEGDNWATLNFPGASRTIATSIDGDNIVGSYVYGDDHGFLYNNGTWTTLDFPEAEATGVYGIDGRNIVGRYRDVSGIYHGFLYVNNEQPVADAGLDQTVYTFIGEVEVVLDGSGSYDLEDDELTYQWTWTVNGNTYNATGVSPTIELPVGEHTVTLTVNDGIEDSAPDEVIITVLEVIESERCWVFPPVIHRNRGASEILVVLRLPEGITKDQVALDEPLVLYPGGIEADRQNAIQWYKRKKVYTSVFAFFDKDALMLAVPDDGRVELEVYGQLNSGQYFYGNDTIRIISRGRWFSWWDFL